MLYWHIVKMTIIEKKLIVKMTQLQKLTLCVKLTLFVKMTLIVVLTIYNWLSNSVRVWRPSAIEHSSKFTVYLGSSGVVCAIVCRFNASICCWFSAKSSSLCEIFENKYLLNCFVDLFKFVSSTVPLPECNIFQIPMISWATWTREMRRKTFSATWFLWTRDLAMIQVEPNHVTLPWRPSHVMLILRQN